MCINFNAWRSRQALKIMHMAWKASAKNSSKLNKFLHSEVNQLIQPIFMFRNIWSSLNILHLFRIEVQSGHKQLAVFKVVCTLGTWSKIYFGNVERHRAAWIWNWKWFYWYLKICLLSFLFKLCKFLFEQDRVTAHIANTSMYTLEACFPGRFTSRHGDM